MVFPGPKYGLGGNSGGEACARSRGEEKKCVRYCEGLGFRSFTVREQNKLHESPINDFYLRYQHSNQKTD